MRLARVGLPSRFKSRIAADISARDARGQCRSRWRAFPAASWIERDGPRRDRIETRGAPVARRGRIPGSRGAGERRPWACASGWTRNLALFSAELPSGNGDSLRNSGWKGQSVSATLDSSLLRPARRGQAPKSGLDGRDLSCKFWLRQPDLTVSFDTPPFADGRRSSPGD